MIDRRDLLVGLGCIAAVGAAEGLRPRHKLVLMPAGAKLAGIVPRRFPGWEPAQGGDIVIPRTEGTLAAQLYSDQLARVYRPAGRSDAPEVMLLIAYGAAQSDVLQLHRPEVCYPAVGFEIIARKPFDLPIGGGRLVPAVALTARLGERIEDILYWTRVGNALPRSAGEQRRDRLRAALQGYVGDGMLVRASAVRAGEAPVHAELAACLAGLTTALAPRDRAAFIGPGLA